MKRFANLNRQERINQVSKNRFSDIALVLENLSEDLNISAILRTAEGFGISKVYIIHPQGEKPRLSNNVSSGAVKWLDLSFYTSVSDCIKDLKKSGYFVIGALVDPQSQSLWEADLNKKIAIMVGNEAQGLSEEAKILVDKNVYIPMFGLTESFNVGVAATIIIYEAVKTRQ